jgi:hypothetical protein
MSKKEKPHYVNNKEFSAAVFAYVEKVNEAKEKGEPIPIVPDYIAECFLKIAEGLSHKSNFIRYTYREEMVMDAVENNLKAILNYDISKTTRTGAPNAFSYFTQITYYAFLRRIQKEKKQHDVKMKYIETAGYEEFLHFGENEEYIPESELTFMDELRTRIDYIHKQDSAIKEFSKNEKKKGLELFMGFEEN